MGRIWTITILSASLLTSACSDPDQGATSGDSGTGGASAGDDGGAVGSTGGGLGGGDQGVTSASTGGQGEGGAGGAAAMVFTPSNAADFGFIEPTGLDVSPPSGTFDTVAQCTPSSVLGACEVASRPGLPDACICRSDRLTIGDLTVTGPRALVLLAYEDVTITGTIELGATGEEAGPGAAFTQSIETAGGGLGSSGGNDGAAPSFDEALVPLIGGVSGGASCSAPGGGGGGALQISAGQTITVTGVISAGGGGGNGGPSDCAGTGGGSGGVVLLEAPEVSATGKVLANGGGGGGGGSRFHGGGYPGTDALLSLDVAPGGGGQDDHGCLAETTFGGYGGSGAAAADEAADGAPGDSTSVCFDTEWVRGGGGGGGLGAVRINTAGGCNCAGDFSPQPSMGTIEG